MTKRIAIAVPVLVVSSLAIGCGGSAPVTGGAQAGDAGTTALFTLTAPPSIFLHAGELLDAGILVTRLDGFAGTVRVAIEGPPAGITAAPIEIAGGDSSGTLALVVSQDAAVGPFMAAIVASGGGQEVRSPVAVTVAPFEPPAVAMALDADVLTLPVGTTRNLAVTLTRTGTFRTAGLPVIVAGLPAGVTAEPMLMPFYQKTAVLRVSAALDAPITSVASAATVEAGAFDVGPCELDCPVLASAPLQVNVVPRFGLAVDSTVASLQPAGTVGVHFRVTRNAGFTGALAVRATGLPAGVTAAEVTLDADAAEAALAIGADASVALGESELLVVASDGAATAAVPLVFHVFAPGTLAVASFSPASAEVFVGQGARLTAVFTGESASIDGIGPVDNGRPIDTPPLARSTTFTLRVRSGSEQLEARTTVRASYRDRFRPVPDAPVGRGAHLAGALPGGGAVLVAGHSSDQGHVPDSTSSELFDSVNERTSVGPELPFSMLAPETVGTQLLDGTLLLVGGSVNSGLGRDHDRATLAFRPLEGRFARTGNTQIDRAGSFGRALVALADGGALLTGGLDRVPLGSAERFDSATGRWRLGAEMVEIRALHTATRLRNGRVLLVGGLQCCRNGGEFFGENAEIYDPDSDSYTEVGSMATGRGLHQATLLADGRVLITGGIGNDFEAPPTSAEIWDVATGGFTAGGGLRAARVEHGAIRLTDGRVLVVGGADPLRRDDGVAITEIYDPSANVWTQGPSLPAAWASSTATLLETGKVLLFGGETPVGDPVATALLFE